MQESKAAAPEKDEGKRLLTNFFAAEICLISGNLLVRVINREALVPAWATATIAIATAIPMLLFAIHFFRILRCDLDEMLQRIVLEGLGFAMILFVPLAGLYVNACAAGMIKQRLDPPELILLPSLLVFIGLMIAWSRLK